MWDSEFEEWVDLDDLEQLGDGKAKLRLTECAPDATVSQVHASQFNFVFTMIMS